MVTKKTLLRKTRALQVLIESYNLNVKSQIDISLSEVLEPIINQHIKTAGQVNTTNNKDLKSLASLGEIIEHQMQCIQQVIIMAMQARVSQIKDSNKDFLGPTDIKLIKKIQDISVNAKALEVDGRKVAVPVVFKIEATQKLVTSFSNFMMRQIVAPAVVGVKVAPEVKKRKLKAKVREIGEFPLPKLNPEQEALHKELIAKETAMNEYLLDIQDLRQKCRQSDDRLIKHQRKMIKSLRDEIKQEVQTKRMEFIKKLNFLSDVSTNSLLRLENRSLKKDEIIDYLTFFKPMSESDLAALRARELTEADIQRLRDIFNIVIQEMTATHLSNFFPKIIDLFKYNRDEIIKGYDLIQARLKELDPENQAFLADKAKLREELKAVESMDQHIQELSIQYSNSSDDFRSGAIKSKLMSQRDVIVREWNDIKDSLLLQVSEIENQADYIMRIPLETDRIKKQLAILDDIRIQNAITIISLADNAQEFEDELNLNRRLNFLREKVKHYQEQVNLLKQDSTCSYWIEYKKDIELLTKLINVASDKRDIRELHSYVDCIEKAMYGLYRKIYSKINEKINHLESLANDLLESFSAEQRPFIDILKGLRENVRRDPSVADYLSLARLIKQQDKRYERAFSDQKNKIARQQARLNTPEVGIYLKMSEVITEQMSLIQLKNRDDARVVILQSLNSKLVGHVNEYLNTGSSNKSTFITKSIATIRDELNSKNLHELTDNTAGPFIVFIRKLLTPLHNFLKRMSGELYRPHFFSNPTEIAVAHAAQKAHMELTSLLSTIDINSSTRPAIVETSV